MEIQEFIHQTEGLRSYLLQYARHYLKNPDDAEDAVQETLVKLWTARDRIPSAPKMKNMATVICRNVSLNMLRKMPETIPFDHEAAFMERGNPQEQLEERESRQKLKQLIHVLSDKHRAILRMRNVEHLPYADIARIMGTTESSVRGMISKARMELLKKWKGTEE